MSILYLNVDTLITAAYIYVHDDEIYMLIKIASLVLERFAISTNLSGRYSIWDQI